jgi:hypothetical protein
MIVQSGHAAGAGNARPAYFQAGLSIDAMHNSNGTVGMIAD